MKRYIVIGAAMLVGVAGTVVAQTTHRTIFERWPNAAWVCGGFEDGTKLMVGAHPDVILVADIPATNVHDRQVCILAEERSDVIVRSGMSAVR